MSGGLLRRRAARVVILDPDDRVLLLEARDPAAPSTPPWWELPGGGIEPGETTADAARREAYEETGLTDLEMGPAVWTQQVEFDFGGYHFDQHEVIHVARSAGGAVRGAALEALEVQAFLGFRWSPAAEVADLVAGGARVIPPWLADELPRRLAEGWPEAPIELGSVG